jgi:hypothetical protein
MCRVDCLFLILLKSGLPTVTVLIGFWYSISPSLSREWLPRELNTWIIVVVVQTKSLHLVGCHSRLPHPPHGPRVECFPNQPARTQHYAKLSPRHEFLNAGLWFFWGQYQPLIGKKQSTTSPKSTLRMCSLDCRLACKWGYWLLQNWRPGGGCGSLKFHFGVAVHCLHDLLGGLFIFGSLSLAFFISCFVSHSPPVLLLAIDS